jgi:hypothetical protein
MLTVFAVAKVALIQPSEAMAVNLSRSLEFMFYVYVKSRKRREDACALLSFAKQNPDMSARFRTECFRSAVRLRTAFRFCQLQY